MKYYMGIDIGAAAIKIAIIDKERNLIASSVTLTGSSFNKNALNALANLLKEKGINESAVCYIMATGYGRKIFKSSDETISEITANAVGASVTNKDNNISTIINIGGQDSKVILLDKNGHVKNFVMNDKCAAGTGRFLEMAARNLEVDITELGELHFNAQGTALDVNSTCTVFAESEIISLLSEGHGKEEITAGIHHSIAKRIVKLAGRTGIRDSVLFDGGTALNQGMVAALEDELMRKVIVPELPQITTAIGAALMARERSLKSIKT